MREMAEAMRQGLAVARRAGMPALVHSLTASVARGEFANRRWDAAARLYEEALARPLGDSPVYPTVRLSECRRQLGQLDEALRQADRALAAARERAEPDGETQALAQRAEVLQDLGREEEARRSIADCLERLEAMRRDLAPSDVLKRGFADVHDDYAVAVDILGRQHRAEDALAAAEQGRARALADLLLSRRAAERTQMAEDRDAGKWRLEATPSGADDTIADATSLTPDDPLDLPEDVAFRSTAAAPALDARALADLARRLDTTLLVYWIQDRGSYVWTVSQNGGVHSARISLRRAAIDDLVRIATTSWPNVAGRGGAAAHLASGPHEAAPALSRLVLRADCPGRAVAALGARRALDDRPARIAFPVVVRGARRPARALSDRALLSRLRAGRGRAGRRVDAACGPPAWYRRPPRRGSTSRARSQWRRAATVGRGACRGAPRRADADG